MESTAPGHSREERERWELASKTVSLEQNLGRTSPSRATIAIPNGIGLPLRVSHGSHTTNARKSFRAFCSLFSRFPTYGFTGRGKFPGGATRKWWDVRCERAHPRAAAAAAGIGRGRYDGVGRFVVRRKAVSRGRPYTGGSAAASKGAAECPHSFSVALHLLVKPPGVGSVAGRTHGSAASLTRSSHAFSIAVHRS